MLKLNQIANISLAISVPAQCYTVYMIYTDKNPLKKYLQDRNDPCSLIATKDSDIISGL